MPSDFGKKRLEAGKLQHYLSVQSPVRTTGSAGGVTVTGWATAANRYGSVEALTSRELWLAQQVQSDATYRIRFRPVAGLTSDWSILWGSRRFQLAGPPLDPVGDGEQVECLCVERIS